MPVAVDTWRDVCYRRLLALCGELELPGSGEKQGADLSLAGGLKWIVGTGFAVGFDKEPSYSRRAK